jgi:hypothetical protein
VKEPELQKSITFDLHALGLEAYDMTGIHLELCLIFGNTCQGPHSPPPLPPRPPPSPAINANKAFYVTGDALTDSVRGIPPVVSQGTYVSEYGGGSRETSNNTLLPTIVMHNTAGQNARTLVQYPLWQSSVFATGFTFNMWVKPAVTKFSSTQSTDGQQYMILAQLKSNDGLSIKFWTMWAGGNALRGGSAFSYFGVSYGTPGGGTLSRSLNGITNTWAMWTFVAKQPIYPNYIDWSSGHQGLLYTIYKDGVNQCPTNSTCAPNDTTCAPWFLQALTAPANNYARVFTQLTLGADASGQAAFDGSLSNVGLYNTAFTAQDVCALYVEQGGKPGLC